VEDYRTNTVLTATAAVQEALVPEQVKLLSLQHKYDPLKGQKEIIKLIQESLDRQLEENKTEITKELQNRGNFVKTWRNRWKPHLQLKSI
jgi:hypothetical protein